MRKPLIIATAAGVVVAAAAVTTIVLVTRDSGDDDPGPFSHIGVDRTAEFELVPWSVDAVGAVTDIATLPDGRVLAALKGGWGGPGVGAVSVYSPEGENLGTVLELDVCTEQERGLVGIAVAPDFDNSGHLYVDYTPFVEGCIAELDRSKIPDDQVVTNRVSRFTYVDGAFDVVTEEILIDGIPAWQGSHVGGGLEFLSDGTLLIGVGEGALARSRDVDIVSGKLLRIDPANPAVAPSDNPFATAPYSADLVANLVYASGMRNPFRFAVDPSDDFVVVGDVGTEVYEELNVIEPGGDYGYPDIEGPGSVDGSIEPTLWYTHDPVCNGTIIGGTFLRPGTFGFPDRTLLLGDFSCGYVWTAEFDGDEIAQLTLIASAPINMSDFVQASDDLVLVAPVGPGLMPIMALTQT